MKDKLAIFLKEHGSKHWSFAARKDEEFMAWVMTQTSDLPEDTAFPARVYAAVSNTSPICEKGNIRSLNTIEKGWRFCGRAGVCECARKSVSENCRESSKSVDQEAAKAKAKETLLKKYGVSNAGQTPNAKKAHTDFYKDQEKVARAVDKGRATMISRYGVDNAFKLDSVNEARRRPRDPLSVKAGAEKRKAIASTGRLTRLGYERVRDRLEQSGVMFLTPVDDYRGTSELHYYDFGCAECGSTFRDKVKDGYTPKCPSCHPSPAPVYVSAAEADIADFIEQYAKVHRSYRRLINPYEIDIYVPDHKLAIEYCGLYWHSEGSGKTSSYHYDKMKECELQGVRLITIFEDEWINKKHIVQSRILNALGLSQRSYARKGTVAAISPAEAKAFLEKHHIQGPATGASINVGLTIDDELMAVMALGKQRITHNVTASGDEYELYRFASNGAVVGAASKMFKWFQRNYSPSMVVSYCDRRWGQGGVYKALGFSLVHETKPGYWWIIDRYKTRSHRFNFTKHKLVEKGHDPSMTEVEIMRSLGHDRIFDCGNFKFVWNAVKSG